MELAFKICEYYKLGLDDLFRRDLRPTESPPETPPPKLSPVSDGDTEGATTESAVRAVAVGLKQPIAATESPPGELAEMKVQMLEWMLKLEKHGVK